MTFKEFMDASLLLPAKVLNGIVSLVFGSAARNADGSVNEKKSFPGLLGLALGTIGLALDLVKWTGRTLSGLVRNHQQAIASAFWMSLLAGGAAALTVAFWPAALAAVTSFSIAGYSIASVFGAEFAMQVGVTAGLAALAASAVTYTVATAVNLVNFLIDCCKPAQPEAEADFEQIDGDTVMPYNISRSLARLGSASTVSHETNLSAAAAPIHTSPFAQPAKSEELAPSAALAAAMTGL